MKMLRHRRAILAVGLCAVAALASIIGAAGPQTREDTFAESPQSGRAIELPKADGPGSNLGPGGATGSKATWVESFDKFLLSDDPLNYGAAHEALFQLDRYAKSARLSGDGRRLAAEKLRKLLEREEPRAIDPKGNTSGVAPPEATLRVYAVQILGKVGSADDVPLLERLRDADRAKHPQMVHPGLRHACETAIAALKGSSEPAPAPPTPAPPEDLGSISVHAPNQWVLSIMPDGSARITQGHVARDDRTAKLPVGTFGFAEAYRGLSALAPSLQGACEIQFQYRKPGHDRHFHASADATISRLFARARQRAGKDFAPLEAVWAEKPPVPPEGNDPHAERPPER
jgi:hypothetical protein